ncbi:FAD-dependent monooxygenase [Saccharopolyspora sp. 5N708]|uniref:FAD-dependent monooxygenase n=1 Tax=Saccharopolyspora sp. 5N708 TaxID=3457424 RepID=UPI003FD1E0B3
MGKNILISGASIAGPALAFWLHKYGFNPTVVERAPAMRDGGYAVDLRGAAVTVAKRMGVLAELREAHTGVRGMSAVDASGRSLAEVRMDELVSSEGDIEIMRGTLGRILYERTSGAEYFFGDSITAVEQDGDGVHVTFEHHAPRRFDLVVGADGLHSNVRRLVFGPESSFRRYLGYHVSIFSTDNFLDLDRWVALYNVPGKLAGSYQARTDPGAKAILGFKSPELRFDHRDPQAQLALLDKAFAGERWIVPRLLEAAQQAPDFYFDSITQIHLGDWARGRVVLLGDAGYCPSPLSGQGSSLAMVGAYLLAGELFAAGGDHHVAFRRYQAEMRNYVALNQKMATDGAKTLIPKTRSGLWLRNQLFRLLPYLPKANTLSKDIRRAANAVDLREYAPAS